VIRLFVSPHLDDVALSCGGHLLRAQAGGERSVVATVFTAGEPGYEARRREDERTLASVGAEVVHLGFPDAPYRPGLRLSYTSLALASELDPRLVDEVAAALARLARDLRAGELWLPLGVGRHIDHRTVFATHARLAGDLVFYEDRPYAFSRELLALRLREIGAPDPPPPPSAEALAISFATLPFLRAYVPTDAERAAAVATHAAQANAAGPGLSLVEEIATFSEGDLAAVAALVAGYGTQAPDLFGAGDAGTVAAAYRQASRSLAAAPLAERRFRLRQFRSPV